MKGKDTVGSEYFSKNCYSDIASIRIDGAENGGIKKIDY